MRMSVHTEYATMLYLVEVHTTRGLSVVRSAHGKKEGNSTREYTSTVTDFL